jgi:hypothetical protein
MVNVYEYDGRGERRIVARVNWDDHNWTDGSTGTHLGITRLKKSRKMVLIHETQGEGSKDWAETVTDEEAIQAILDNDPDELSNWPHLQAISEKQMDTDA